MSLETTPTWHAYNVDKSWQTNQSNDKPNIIQVLWAQTSGTHSAWSAKI